LVRAQRRRVHGGQPLRGGELHQLFGVQRDQRHRVRPAVAVDHHLADERVALQEVLDVLGGDVHAARRHDEILFSIRDEEEPVLVEAPDVAGGEPPIGEEYLGSGVRLLEVALGNVAPAAENLAVRRQLDLDGRQRKADRPELEVVFPVVREHWARFGEAVALEDQDARRVEELGDLA
jgi:hypothetical protein